MPSRNEQVKPVAFEAMDSTPETTTVHTSRPNWVAPALGGLVTIALIVVFWLPGRFEPGPSQPEAITNQSVDTVAPSTTSARREDTPDKASPWSDAQLAKLRKQAQDVLAVLLEVQFELQESGVDQWAVTSFEEAKSIAGEGDLQYRERDFVAAASSYQQALDQLEALADSAPKVRSDQLEEARLAIERGEPEPALAALTIAAAIDSQGELLANLNHRAQTLEQLLPLLSEAEQAEETGDLPTARDLLERAASLDPEHNRVADELARVIAAHTTQQFNKAMSAGYSALDLGQFTDAKRSFRKAAKLSPDSTEAPSALRDVDTAETLWRLSTLQTRGQEQEAQEQWQRAVESFEEALKIDRNLLFAQQGLVRSRARAQLDKQFRTAIEQPNRLSEKAVADATARLITQAATITPQGPVLQTQLRKLEALLEKANREISLSLRSDGETEVTLRKVARLGLFEQKVLSIRPGTYTAVGSRDGYRDIRLTFTISHEQVASDIVIICTEKI